MRFGLHVRFITWRLAFCGRQLKYFHDPYLKSVSLFYAIASSFALLEIAEMFHSAGALRLDNRKVFGCPGCKVSLVFFFFCFRHKYDSIVKMLVSIHVADSSVSCVLGRV